MKNKTKDERLKVKGYRKLSGLLVLSVFIFQFSLSSCNPEAKYETKDVEVFMTIDT